MAAFVERITREDAAGDSARDQLYSAGLTPDLIYALRSKRQQELGAAKLVAALAACEDLEVVVEGPAKEGSVASRWVVRARPEPPTSRPQADHAPDAFTDDAAPDLSASREIQLSLFSCLQSTESLEIEMRDVQFTRKDPHRADIRVDFVMRPRRVG